MSLLYIIKKEHTKLYSLQNGKTKIGLLALYIELVGAATNRTMLVSSDCSVVDHNETISIRKTLQRKSPQMLASIPLITKDDNNMHWQGMLATYVYSLFSVDSDNQKKFWDCWKADVYKMMRIKRNYVMSVIQRSMVGT